jgi:Flp pilus assembly protein TadB
MTRGSHLWIPTLVATVSVGAALATGSAAVGLILLGYGIAGHLAQQRNRKAKQREALRARSLDILAGVAADLRAGAEPAILFLPDAGLERLARAAQRMSDRTGAPLAELLERLEVQQRDLSRARAAAHSQVAGIRLTSLLLAVLPLVALCMGQAIGADAFGMLLATPFGTGCVAVAVALQLGGLAWADRLAGQTSLLPKTRRGLRRLAHDPVRAPVGEELAAAADLIAAALRAGSPVSTAVLATGDAMAGPLSRHLLQIGHQLRLGVPAETAWQPLVGLESSSVTAVPLSRAGEGLGRRRNEPVSSGAVHLMLSPRWRRMFDAVKRRRRHGIDAGRQMAEAARRSAQSGAALSRSLTRCADDLRAQSRDRLQARLQRSAVWLVLPLGLCFLPAFLLAGIVPVVLAVLGEVW